MAADVGLATVEVSEDLRRGLRNSTRYLTNRLLEQNHWSRITESLASQWDKFQSLAAAIKLMEQHGVKLTQQEEERLAQLSETQMIEALVQKMPQQSKEQFQHFFLQLQLIVSTATRVSQGLEAGQPGMVEQALNDADSTGITQYTLKMAIVQAGVETLSLQKQHESWVKDAEAQMSRLVQGQREARDAKTRLTKARNELLLHKGSQSEKVKRVLLTFTSGSNSALLHATFSAWMEFTKKMQREYAIYEEYRERIEFAEGRLISARAEQLKNVTAVFEKKQAGRGASFLAEVFECWKQPILDRQLDEANMEQMAMLQAKLRSMSAQQAENAKKVMERIGAGSGLGTRNSCFQTWAALLIESKTNKEFEDRVREAEKRVQAFMKEKSEGAKSVLAKMAGGTDTGLLHCVVTAWFQYTLAEKRANELAEVANSNADMFSQFGMRNKQGAMSLMDQYIKNGIIMIYLKVWGAWRLSVSVEQLLRDHGMKIDGKRQQLMGVQQMFRNFAVNLETSIRTGQDIDDGELTQDSVRASERQKQKHRKQLARSDGATSSLPEIHAQDSRYNAGFAAGQASVRGMGQALPRDRSWG